MSETTNELQQHVNVVTGFVNKINESPHQQVAIDMGESLDASASAKLLDERFEEVPDAYKPAVRILVDGVQSFINDPKHVHINVITDGD